MTPAENPLWDRWDDVDRLLDEALDRPAHDRIGYVTRAAGSDASLRDVVLRLLSRLGEDDVRVSGPAPDMWREAFPHSELEDVADLPAGTEVGKYVVVTRLGRGGMATVYEARRADGAYEQRVALKVIRRGLDTDDLVRRFLIERQILSSLNHPNIARLLDGGAMPDGRPYLVMELVEGDKVTTYADRTALSLRGRLDLVVAVAGAVHAAHRSLVVHRDIKPSNILVSSEGNVKLLDFGIAKLLAPDADRMQTDGGSRALTPDYASPEQIRGDVITTSSDVYQVGLLMRELLEATPSTGIVARDLEIIIGKALRHDPEQRYTSAEELALDIRRHLDGLPIHAHPESALYRFRKFTKRHVWVVRGVAAAVLAIAGFTIALAVQNLKIALERDTARAATERAVATQDFLVEILRSPDPTVPGQNRDITVVDALQRGRSRVMQELAGQPEVQAGLLAAMARTFSGLGRYETADTLFSASAALFDSLFGESDVRRTNVLSEQAATHVRMRRFGTADSLRQQVYQLKMRSDPSRKDEAYMLFNLGTTARELGRTDSALALVERGMALLASSGDTLDADYESALMQLGFALRGVGRLDSAQAVYTEVLRRQLSNPGTPSGKLTLTYNNLGFVLRLRKDYDAAEEYYREGLRIAGSTLGLGHPEAMLISNNLAAVLDLGGKVDAVVELGRSRIAAVEREWPNGHVLVGEAYAALGRFLLRRGRPAEALVEIQKGLVSLTTTLGPDNRTVLVSQANEGAAMLLLGRRREGLALLNRAHLALLRLAQTPIEARDEIPITQMIAVLEAHGFTEMAARYQALLVRR